MKRFPSNSARLRVAAALALLPASHLLRAADAVPTPPPAIGTAAKAPATSPGEQNAPTAGTPGARGGGGGRGGSSPITPESLAAMAKLNELPAWKPGAGNGDYSAGPAYVPAPENAPRANVPKGRVETFQIPLVGSKFFPPGVGGRGRGAPADGAATNAPTREVNVYVPAGYVPGTAAPLLVCHDAMGMHDTPPAPYLPTILDNMIADKRLPPMVVVMLMHGGQSQRSFEYDTLSDQYARFVVQELLPHVVAEHKLKISSDPADRAICGMSSGGICAFTAAWEHPEWFGNVLSHIGSFTNIICVTTNLYVHAWVLF